MIRWTQAQLDAAAARDGADLGGGARLHVGDDIGECELAMNHAAQMLHLRRGK